MASWSSSSEEPLWVYPPINTAWRDAIVKEFKIHPVTAQILVTRKFKDLDEVHRFLYAKLPDLHDPFLLPGMDIAVARLIKALTNGECICIYGDNDVDGMTGTALLTEFLQLLGGKVIFFVASPGSSRQNLIVEALEEAVKQQCRLLITVDCGVTAHREVEQVIAAGIDVIVTDHHEATAAVPRCTAILNPKYAGGGYPNRDLTGVGVAFKLAHGLTNQLTADGVIAPRKIDLKRFLDLVALGTISDMGALRGENRILVRYGLQQLQHTKRVGLAKLLRVSDADSGYEELSTYTVASKVAPRLNSLGRISDPKKGVELLLVRNAQKAEELALELDLNNIERQKIERGMSQDVEQRLATTPELLQHKAIVLAGAGWHPGIIAILSTRISKYYNRPTCIIAVEKGIGKGSIRSIPEFPVLEVLKECSDLLINFGGHDYAAGITLMEEHIPAFTSHFLAAAEARLQPNDIMNKLILDAEVRLSDLTFELMESISLLAPYGNENPQPLLYACAQQAWPPKVVGKNHLRMYLEELHNPTMIIEGIAYGRSSACEGLRRKNLALQVAFTPQINEYLGPSIQLIVRDFKTMEGTAS